MHSVTWKFLRNEITIDPVKGRIKDTIVILLRRNFYVTETINTISKNTIFVKAFHITVPLIYHVRRFNMKEWKALTNTVFFEIVFMGVVIWMLVFHELLSYPVGNDVFNVT